MGDPGTALFNGHPKVGDNLTEDLQGVGQGRRVTTGSHPGVGQQVSNHSLHSSGAIHRETDKVVGISVELSLVPPIQQFNIARHHPQGFLKIMGGDIGELLEISVAPFQFLGLLRQYPGRSLSILDLGG